MAYSESRCISIIDRTADKQGVLKRYHNNISRNRFGGNENQVFWRKQWPPHFHLFNFYVITIYIINHLSEESQLIPELIGINLLKNDLI
jgi:DNA-binding Lrp family transcriptional regulator